MLKYELDEIRHGQIHITLPETIEPPFGTPFPIAAFGGPIGTSAPLQEFELIIQIQEGVTAEESITLTIDVGSLPLDTSHWRDIQLCFLANGHAVEIPVESVIFLSDNPLVYKVYLKVDVHDEYTQYEFTMPYHDVRITIVDETG